MRGSNKMPALQGTAIKWFYWWEFEIQQVRMICPGSKFQCWVMKLRLPSKTTLLIKTTLLVILSFNFLLLYVLIRKKEITNKYNAVFPCIVPYFPCLVGFGEEQNGSIENVIWVK